jgi:hypothetical protein
MSMAIHVLNHDLLHRTRPQTKRANTPTIFYERATPEKEEEKRHTATKKETNKISQTNKAEQTFPNTTP